MNTEKSVSDQLRSHLTADVDRTISRENSMSLNEKIAFLEQLWEVEKFIDDLVLRERRN